MSEEKSLKHLRYCLLCLGREALQKKQHEPLFGVLEIRVSTVRYIVLTGQNEKRKQAWQD